MDTIAIISDIHANLAAMEAVLADIRSLDVATVYCLGDVIGYGPQPVQCLDHARKLKLNILGNHEEAVLYGCVGFNARARQAIEWTRDQLLNEKDNAEDRRARWDFLAEMLLRHDEGKVSWVHGSPREPTREYIFHSDVNDPDKLDGLFGTMKSVCFVGHTHVPGIILKSATYLHPTQLPETGYAIDEDPVLCNVGSVGQPRDGDPRGCYVLWDGQRIRYRRVEYDVDRTVQAILDTSELPPSLGLRLKEGR